MALTPKRDGRVNVGIRDNWRDNLLLESGAASSRNHVGRGCQLSCSSNSETSNAYGKRGVQPGHVLTEIDVHYFAQYTPKGPIKSLQLLKEKARCSAKDIEHFRDSKLILKEYKGVLAG